MKLSNLYLPTAKEAPADAQLTSHKLMLRAGLIYKLGSGLYSWQPLGLKVLRKVEKIVHEEMQAIGAQEILMPAVQPKDLWDESGRWDEFGPQLLKIVDRQGREFCFGPTHEEVVTDLIRHNVKSYKQLPFSLYQIQSKFRDEIRPRFGIMRAREFMMKDAYSFHIDNESLESTYEKFFNAYAEIIERIGLKYRVVDADAGSIGGKRSQEFHAIADSGEDILVYSSDSSYAANIEKASCLVNDRIAPKELNKIEKISTPNIKTVDEQSEFLNINSETIVKSLLVKSSDPQNPIIAILLRGDRELNEIKAQNHPDILSPLTLASDTEVEQACGCKPGSVGPLGLNLPIIADREVLQLNNFSCGVNETDMHYIGVNWERDVPLPTNIADLITVKEGDTSPDGKGVLKFARGIELGHIFQLGTKYSKALGANVLNMAGKPQPISMGCYGIGVSRIVAATIEQSHDENGIIWPESIAPFSIIIIPISYHKDEKIKSIADEIYNKILATGVDVLLDDRNIRPGVAFKDAELIGIPHRIVIGKKILENSCVEYIRRHDSYKAELNLATLKDKISSFQLTDFFNNINKE
ncbi:MAG: proline--tRNA ligase [Francisellaceae bacterium]|mgnify:CR=1 FL=1|jgi:prolyl-tRNA synthetase|nr:proline--tRNA ligase [Francisellaceae bacterium]MBT6207979.1 proline--tRNA ligase [Francisellaceae bacterium]MBT6538476.1 proline--tRNA ligase [Francisellaceae bacterium]